MADPCCLSLVLSFALTPYQAHTTPLVGVWVKGPDSPLHPLVAAACLKFYYSSTLLDRALQGHDSFLLLLCPEGAAACMHAWLTDAACSMPPVLPWLPLASPA